MTDRPFCNSPHPTWGSPCGDTPGHPGDHSHISAGSWHEWPNRELERCPGRAPFEHEPRAHAHTGCAPCLATVLEDANDERIDYVRAELSRALGRGTRALADVLGPDALVTLEVLGIALVPLPVDPGPWTHSTGCDDCTDYDGRPFHHAELDTGWPIGTDEPSCGICGHELEHGEPEELSDWTPGESDLIDAHDDGEHDELEPGCPRCEPVS